MEKYVEVLATQLNQKPEVIEEALKTEGEIEKLVDQYSSTHKIFTSEELGKKIDNANREYLEKLATDGKPIPSHIYNYVKGNAFEKHEKEWAKEHGIEKWDGIDDLKSQIIVKEIAKSGKATDNEVIKKKDDRISELEGLVLGEEGKSKLAIEQAEGRISEKMIKFDIDNARDAVDIDAEGEKLDNQRSILDAVFRQHHTFEFNKDLNRTVVSDKDGKILQNKVGEPLSVSEVLVDFAPKWVDLKKVSTGGRGDKTAIGKSDGTLKTIMNMNELAEYAAKQNPPIYPGTGAFSDLMIAVGKENPSFNK